MNLFNRSLNFQKKNIVWPITSIIFIFIYYPIEMLIFGFLFGKIFSKIGDIKKLCNIHILPCTVILCSIHIVLCNKHSYPINTFLLYLLDKF